MRCKARLAAYVQIDFRDIIYAETAHRIHLGGFNEGAVCQIYVITVQKKKRGHRSNIQASDRMLIWHLMTHSDA